MSRVRILPSEQSDGRPVCARRHAEVTQLVRVSVFQTEGAGSSPVFRSIPFYSLKQGTFACLGGTLRRNALASRSRSSRSVSAKPKGNNAIPLIHLRLKYAPSQATLASANEGELWTPWLSPTSPNACSEEGTTVSQPHLIPNEETPQVPSELDESLFYIDAAGDDLYTEPETADEHE